ncbi:tRNA preQ1(34) S-adenosylmethionine ribosyltransferase-isomerase QueA [Methyloferula stellata]|uniref:tRNA preQ1(34) S-adenosylmethionine ribosyltransferase-isomerase QueA n=1 Tax=Methyloferula stellata TaxID=876270 RepID=UPI0003810BF4|nr:tRNA preQ1(34) S-adenosylmethionine ribosyltransferase-isomerase QueA [Methyloferula stellata]
MRVDLFDFKLPPDRIALRPAEPRDAARLLVVRPSAAPMLEDRTIANLRNLLQAGDVLVVNDTRVIPASLEGTRLRGEAEAHIHVTLHKRESDSSWRAFVKPAKKLKIGETIVFTANADADPAPLHAEVREKSGEGEVLLAFSLEGTALDEALEHFGQMPLPPYIAGKRAIDARDAEDYQTLFAARSGAVAAPTASLHFTPALIAAIEAQGVNICRVTLHVGAGTFLPVKAEDTEQHRMHAEWGEVSAEAAETLNKVRAAGGRIVAAGTTSLRILESAAAPSGEVRAFKGDTSIFITPGYKFRAVDLLLTNFHLPRSTLFMLVSAFSGLDVMRSAYSHAIASHYRFYSYGDACLLHRAPEAGV